LGELARIEPELLKLGYQIIAISLDTPEYLAQSKTTHQAKYTMLSDSEGLAARAFGIAWHLEPPVYDQYRSLGNDIERASGQKHHILPVPATFVVNKAGIITFTYVHPDHRVRVNAEVLLAAAKAGLQE
jgi:peroxiredoxin